VFFSPIVPLLELNGNPVTHSIRLILTPPGGLTVVIRQSLRTGSLTIKQGGKTVDTGGHDPVARIDGDRVLISVPEKIGVRPDWSVQAEVDVEGKEPICPYAPEVRKRSTITPAVTVGSLSGEDQRGAITFSPVETSSAPDGKQMPAGSKIKTVTMQQNADGSLVVVATMDGDVMDLPTSGAEPFTSLDIVLDLASPSFFGLVYPYELDWHFPLNGVPEPVARISDPYFSSAITLGEVPVTVDGDQVRFDFGGFKAYPPDTTGLTQSFVPFGDFGMLFFGSAPHDDPICLCPEGPDLPADFVPNPDDDVLSYQIIGNLISITHADSNVTAYGWIDYEGRFQAENDIERYKGVIKLFPADEGFEVGVQASYLRKLDGTQRSYTAPAAQAVKLGHWQTSGTANRWLGQDGEDSLGDVFAFYEAQQLLEKYTDTAIQNCLEGKPAYGPDPMSPSSGKLVKIDCAQVRNAYDVLQYLTSKYSNDPNFQRAYQQMLAQSQGMGVPATTDDSIFDQFAYTPGATPVAGGIPFPLPLSIASPYEPSAINADWAIRAGSFYSYTNDAGGVTLSVTSPFIDSHLLLSGAILANGSGRQPVAPTTADSVVAESEIRRSRRTRNRQRPISSTSGFDTIGQKVTPLGLEPRTNGLKDRGWRA